MSAAPSLGLFALNQHAGGEVLERVGPLAEELGYDSVWTGEHVVVPDPRVPPSPMEPLDPILDPVVALAFLAARTSRIRLATGIIVLPQRNPLVLAKQLASLDAVSGGRLVFGMGVGYLEPEMTAIGVAMERRGARAVEYLAAMRALWEQDQPAFDGEFVRVLRGERPSATRAEAAAGGDGRSQPGGAPPRRATRGRLVRLLPAAGRNRGAARGPAAQPRRGRSGRRRLRDQRHAPRAHRRRGGSRLRPPGREPPGPPATARRRGRRDRGLRPRPRSGAPRRREPRRLGDSPGRGFRRDLRHHGQHLVGEPWRRRRH